MRIRSVLVGTAMAAALVLAAGGQAATRDTAPPTLTGTVGPGFTISLTTADGQPVTTLVEGTYVVNVSDKASVHDFHLFGPSVNQTTGVADVGDTTWTVNLVPGGYAYVCDPHETGAMRGTFMVVPATHVAAPLTKLQVVGPRPRTRGSGSFFASISRSSSGGATLNWNLAFNGLTGPPTSAQIRLGYAGLSGKAVIPLCTACTSGSKGTTEIPAAVLQPLLNGRTYIEIVTKRNPAGEIRGQLSIQG